MRARRLRCTVLEVGLDDALVSQPAPPRELPPWADPYIARLVEKYRLRSALNDSLQFLANDTGQQADPARLANGTVGGCSTVPRFTLPDRR